MSTRHRIVTLVLLSSSTTALARPHRPKLVAPAAPAPSELRQVRAELAELIDPEALPRFQALTDGDGYPFVGNVKTKGSRHQDAEIDDEMDEVVRVPPSSRLTTGFVARNFHVNGRGERIDL